MSYNAVLTGILIADIEVFNRALDELAAEYGVSVTHAAIEEIKSYYGKYAIFDGITLSLDRQDAVNNETGMMETSYRMRYDTDHTNKLARLFGLIDDPVFDTTRNLEGVMLMSANYQDRKGANARAEIVAGPILQRYAVLEIEKQAAEQGLSYYRNTCDDGAMQVVVEAA